MTDDTRPDAGDPAGQFSLPDIADLEAQFASETYPVADAEPDTADIRPAPNWGIESLSTPVLFPPIRRIVVPVLMMIVAIAAAVYVFVDPPEQVVQDASYAALVDYVDHLATNGPELPVSSDLAAALAAARRATSTDGSSRLSLAGPEGCWSVLLPADLSSLESQRPTPVRVDVDTCR